MGSKDPNRRRTLGIAVGAAVLGAVIAWRAAAAARERRRLLRRGVIRPLQDLWLTVRGRRMYARVSTVASTDRLPVVLVHGFGVSSSYFVPAAERLGREFTVYAPDLPGHGKSDSPAKPLDVRGLADALIEWMDAAGIARAMLVGNSMGCQTVVDAAVRYPERVERLVLIGPTTDPAAPTVRAHALRLIEASPFERLSLIPLLVWDYVRMGWRLIPELRSMLRYHTDTRLPLLRIPVMLVRGQHDPVAPQRWLDEAARLSRAQREVVIRGWGHAVHYSAAPQFVAAVTPFLKAGPMDGWRHASRDREGAHGRSNGPLPHGRGSHHAPHGP